MKTFVIADMHLNHEHIITLENDPRWAVDGVVLKYGGFSFFMVHNTDTFGGQIEALNGEMFWTIHGHAHSHRPLIDVERRSSCVSVENINYTPMNLEDLTVKIKQDIRAAGW